MATFANVTDILKAEGFGPRLSFTNFHVAALLGNCVANRIESPAARAMFVAVATADLMRLDFQAFEALDEEKIFDLLELVIAQPASPAGPTEMWGVLMQMVEAA